MQAFVRLQKGRWQMEAVEKIGKSFFFLPLLMRDKLFPNLRTKAFFSSRCTFLELVSKKKNQVGGKRDLEGPSTVQY